MELFDVYDRNKMFTGKVKEKHDFLENEYSMSCFIWIVNENGELLIQQRSLKDDNKPGLWSITGGAVDCGETSLDASVRELNEEIGLKIDKDELFLIATERRKNKFFEYYFLEKNIDLEQLTLQKEEVESVKWITIDEYENNISNALNFQLFKNFYYNIYLEEIKKPKLK